MIQYSGRELYEFAADLYPICRSITGDGLRQTLSMIGQRIPLEMVEIASGTTAFDWIVPKEWTIRDAYIKTSGGDRIIDFRQCNLHVLNYSRPIHQTMPLAELRPHLFSLPEHPDWIPYRTSYYEEEWGFCLSHRQFSRLEDGEYEVCIDSSLEDGSLTYGECFVPGDSDDEVLISCHVCHPSVANDNLSGTVVAAFLAELVGNRLHRRYSYRFLFVPGTIGAIAWLSKNRDAASRVRHGLVLTCVGDRAHFRYKKSRQGSADVDRVAEHVLRHTGEAFEIIPFSPFGYDERQYCSPGFDLPVGCLMRSVWGTFPEYHTSADDMDFITPRQLAGSLQVTTDMIDVLEHDRVYRNLSPYGEPQLGRRNLYGAGDAPADREMVNARLWVLNMSDGRHSLLDIAERSELPFPLMKQAADSLVDAGLLAMIDEADYSARGSGS